MSMPEDTPAAVTTLPRCTTRSGTGTAPSAASSSRASQCVVASTPSRIPAAASSSDPVHTEVVHVLCAWASRSQPSDRLVVEQVARAVAARHDHDVRVRVLAQRRVGGHGQRALLGAHRAGLGGHEGQLGAGDAAEDVVGADGVQRGEAVVEQDGDLHGWAPRVRGRAPGTGSGGGTRPARRRGRARRRGAWSRSSRTRTRARRRRWAPRCPRGGDERPRRARARRSAAGVSPTSARKRRAKWRGLMATRSAMASTERSPSGWSSIHCCRSRMASRSANWEASWAENWDWPPGRRRKSTSPRATPSATPRPRSSSTMARARSMPAVTPAEVHRSPSRV